MVTVSKSYTSVCYNDGDAPLRRATSSQIEPRGACRLSGVFPYLNRLSLPCRQSDDGHYHSKDRAKRDNRLSIHKRHLLSEMSPKATKHRRTPFYINDGHGVEFGGKVVWFQSDGEME